MFSGCGYDVVFISHRVEEVHFFSSVVDAVQANKAIDYFQLKASVFALIRDDPVLT